MDAQQLNRINELAREYLRLGIAKSTTDAVEKARFQLSFESAPKKENQSPYDVLFKGMPEAPQKPQSDREESVLEEQQSITSQNNEGIQAINNAKILEETRKMMRGHETRISSQFLELIEQQKKEMENQKSRLLSLENELAMLKRNIRDSKESATTSNESPASQVISSTIEQTIKGRVVRADDVAIDKIFYFGTK